MKRSTFYTPLVISLIFGFIVGSISISPVFGDTACQGTGNSTARVIMAGRVLTPSTILRSAPCLSGETALNVLNLTRTVIVSPNGTPSQNGTTLLAAMQTISNANPSAGNPWLLKLEPGNYDLGNQSLMLLPYVDLEGSGEGTTTISSTVGSSNLPAILAPISGTVTMSSTTEVRFVRLVNYGSNPHQTALSVPIGADNARVTHVTTYVSGGVSNYGLFNLSVKPITITNGTLSASGGFYSYGLASNYPNKSVNVLNSLLTGSDATGANEGLIIVGGNFGSPNAKLLIQNSILRISGSGTGMGLNSTDTDVSITNSTLEVSSQGGLNNNTYGIQNIDGNLTVQGSKISATGGDANWGIYDSISPNITATLAVNNSLVASLGGTLSYGLVHSGQSNGTIQNSVLSASGGSTESYTFGSTGILKVGASQLSGTSGIVKLPNGGTLTCVASYDANFAPLNSNCTTGP